MCNLQGRHMDIKYLPLPLTCQFLQWLYHAPLQALPVASPSFCILWQPFGNVLEVSCDPTLDSPAHYAFDVVFVPTA